MSLIIIGFLIALFIGVSSLLFMSIRQMHGNARIVNYVGIVRGATQKLIKEELYGYEDDALIMRLDGIIQELLTGSGPNNLTVMPDEIYLEYMRQISAFWMDIKDEIALIRTGKDTTVLFEISQEYFNLVDRTVTAAEEYSETKVVRVNLLLTINNFLFAIIIAAIVFFYIKAVFMQNDLVTAKASSKAKSDFLSRMSHEIRTPLNAIIGMSSLAQKADDVAKVRYCLNKVESASVQLLDIVNDILDMSKIEANQLEIHLHEFYLDHMLQSVFNVVQVKADEKNQPLRFISNAVFTRNMVSDELRLTQVLVNLLNNAVKFSPQDSEITLYINQLEEREDGSKLQFIVEDKGIGITEEQMGKLFHSFEQADNSITRKYGGTGLGLAICKRIVELLGGDIWVESSCGKGSRFVFELEILWGEDCLSAITGEIAENCYSALVLESDLHYQEYFQKILHAASVHTQSAMDWTQTAAISHSAVDSAQPFDFVVLDWSTLQSGLTALPQINCVLAENAAVIITASSNIEEMQEAAGTWEFSGLLLFLPKPLLPSVLLNAIAGLRADNAPQNAEASIQDAEQYWKGRWILLVEDVEINQEIIISMLEETGVGVDTADNGREAVDMFEVNETKYDAILMDMQMPVLDGLSASRQIRALAKGKSDTIPIIALTANAFNEDIARCMDAGMNAHIAKPVDMDTLLNTLHQYL